jgi:hypothetical protein
MAIRVSEKRLISQFCQNLRESCGAKTGEGSAGKVPRPIQALLPQNDQTKRARERYYLQK